MIRISTVSRARVSNRFGARICVVKGIDQGQGHASFNRMVTFYFFQKLQRRLSLIIDVPVEKHAGFFIFKMGV